MEEVNPQLEEEKALLVKLSAAGPGSVVKAYLTLRNISQTELAKRLNTTSSEISRVIAGKRKTQHIREAIAREIGLPVELLFGAR
jgi:transcriptional regulator with XRE-family HTH domain